MHAIGEKFPFQILKEARTGYAQFPFGHSEFEIPFCHIQVQVSTEQPQCATTIQSSALFPLINEELNTSD